ncbi:MAG TPA: hypothetical protein VFS34_03695 [Thermoanaerobaculia bacterium]|nr:hypothetical protein [Thermoanaerobaculia bacterium]
MSAAGLVVRVDGTEYFIPAERVGFVAPVREVREGELVMPRGRLALVDPGRRDPSTRQAAVAIRRGTDFVALAVDSVDLADAAAAERAIPISVLDAVLGAGEPPARS